ncbi:hypothetical protein NIES2109_38990 [Nostoc sp. HK-01]|nr:hypothetical protein NIES2109_38990 [Nostoc sp. HK-01]
MNKLIINWWRSQQFKLALHRGDNRSALQILQKIQKSGAKFSSLEKVFREKIQLERDLEEHKREITNLRKQIVEKSKLNLLLHPNPELIKYLSKSFKLIQHDEYKLQATGIDERIFEDFEARLAEYIQEELNKIPEQKLLIKLEDAVEDISSLKVGQEPDYRFTLTPHVYFMKYFLENVYCLYLAWSLIYQDGLLPTKFNILDIAAGPGTTAYGLALFLQSCSSFVDIPQMHVSYYSLEKQDAFQYRGLQFWRKYIESRKTPVNNFFRFVTTDIFAWDVKSSNIPKNFFDFIVISHCFFTDSSKRIQSNNIYKEIFANSLNNQGYVLLIIQDKKLFKAYDADQTEDKEQEENMISQFIEELGLHLVWYKYLTSTSLRKPLAASEFGKFAKDNLPKQIYMNQLLKKYCNQNYESHYTLDDYVILAKK